MRFLHSVWPARIGFAVLLIVEILGSVGILPISPEFTWKGLLIQNLFVWAVVEWANFLIKKHDLPMYLGPVALFVMLQLAADAVGDMAHWYSDFVWYDQILHFSGGFMASLLFTGFLQSIHRKRNRLIFPRGEVLLLGLSVSVVSQVLYEMEEYLEDVLTGSNRLGDGFDTANDLTLGLFGAILAALVVVLFPKLMSKRQK